MATIYPWLQERACATHQSSKLSTGAHCVRQQCGDAAVGMRYSTAIAKINAVWTQTPKTYVFLAIRRLLKGELLHCHSALWLGNACGLLRSNGAQWEKSMCRLYMLEMQAPARCPSFSLVRLLSQSRREPIIALPGFISFNRPLDSVHTSQNTGSRM